MKKVFLLLSLVTLTILIHAESTWSLRTGVNISPGLLYNSKWDPGYNGNSLSIIGLWNTGPFVFGAGLEGGFNYTGFHLLMPLHAGITAIKKEALSLLCNIELLPGLLLTRPAPYFLISAGISAEIVWRISSGFALSLSGGPRYTLSPDYSATVAPLETLDIHSGINAIWYF